MYFPHTCKHRLIKMILWLTLGSFVLLRIEKSLTPSKELHNFNSNKIKGRFEQMDSIVNDVYKIYGNQLHELIERKIPWREEPQK